MYTAQRISLITADNPFFFSCYYTNHFKLSTVLYYFVLVPHSSGLEIQGEISRFSLEIWKSYLKEFCRQEPSSQEIINF